MIFRRKKYPKTKQVKQPVKRIPFKDKKDMPDFSFCSDEKSLKVVMTGRAIPENVEIAWIPFLNKLIENIENKKVLIIDFKLDYYNSASNRYITDMFNLLSKQYPFMKSVINWYFFEADEETEADAEMYQESNPKIKFNFIIRKD